MSNPCERCEPLFFDMDTEWAQEFARVVRERDAMREALLDVCSQVFDRMSFDALTLPSVRRALGEDDARRLRRIWHDARATVDHRG